MPGMPGAPGSPRCRLQPGQRAGLGAEIFWLHWRRTGEGGGRRAAPTGGPEEHLRVLLSVGAKIPRISTHVRRVLAQL